MILFAPAAAALATAAPCSKRKRNAEMQKAALRSAKSCLFLAAKTSGDFAQPRKRSGFLPPRFECPREDLLEMLPLATPRFGGSKKFGGYGLVS